MNYHIETDELTERLKWLVKLRWFGIIGVFVGTHMLREIAFLSFSLIPVYLILGFAALYNVFYNHALKTGIKDPKVLAVSQIFLDQVTLTLAMYFSGGCDSPFIYFFIFHIVISGILLSWQYTLAFSLLAVFFPAVVMGLKHIGVLPHYGIFRDEPMLFTNMTVVASYGFSFVATIFLTAYFVTYLSRRLYEKNEEVRRLYALSERLRSSIRISEVISIIERELCGYAGVGSSVYISLDKARRVLLFRTNEKEINIPLVDKNCFSDALLKGSAMMIDLRTVTSDYEKEALTLMNTQRLLVLPVTAASVNPCYDYFHCNDKACEAYGREAGQCWQMSVTHCRGKIMRNYIEKLDTCLACELFTPVGLYALSVPAGFTPLDKIDVDACMRLLNAAGLAVSNALLYEKTLELSKVDGLTGLKNQREFKEAFQSEYLRAKRYKRRFSVMMIDADNFKLYNDTHGHPQGDILLKKIAALISENLKETDVIARYGGEEFAVLMLETSKTEGFEVAERLRSMVEWCKFPKEETQPGGRLTVSIGVSGYPEDGESVEELLEAADAALYCAKRRGKNMVLAAGACD